MPAAVGRSGIERGLVGTVFRTFKIFCFVFSFIEVILRAFCLPGCGKVREREASGITQVCCRAYEWVMEPFTVKKCRRTASVGEGVGERL